MKQLGSMTGRLFLAAGCSIGSNLISAMPRLISIAFFLLIAATPRHALSTGFDGSGSATGCFLPSMSIVGTFTATGAKYVAHGTCSRDGSLGSTITFSWTAEGVYSNGVAQEKLEVPPALISQPSHTYGKWQTQYSCRNGDPWLTGVTCDVTGTTDDVPNFKDQTLQNQFSGYRRERPITAFLSQAQRNALAVTRASQIVAESAAQQREQQLLQGAAQSKATSYSAALFPLVLAPTAGLKVYERTPMSIKLAPPQAWADTQVKLDGTPIKTAQSVTGYRVALQRKDAKGNWVANSTLPVGAVEASSAGGYTGFGAGAPPAFLALPGAWRLNAQVSYPKESGWSNWTEFTVLPLTVTPFQYGQPSAPFTIKK